MAHRLPPLSTLRPFEAAARHESFSKAADELHLTHGAVSHQVRALEAFLGTPLFERHGKRVAVTAAGRLLAERVRSAMDDIARAVEQARGSGRPRGLTVSVLPSFASRWLMPRLIRFMDANPEIEITVNASTALANFSGDEVDVAIRYGVGPWPGLACEQILEDECFPVASPKMNRGRLPKTAKELLGVRIIREDRDYWQEWLAAAGVTVEGPLGGPSFNDATYALQAAIRGEGVAMTRRSLVGDDIERGTLVQLFPLTVRPKQSYWLVCRKDQAATPKVKAFRDWVLDELKK